MAWRSAPTASASPPQALTRQSSSGTPRWPGLLTLKGHTGDVAGVVIHPDGKRLASASWDETVKLWDVVPGQELLTLKGHDNVTGVAFSPDGNLLAAANRDETLKLWHVPTGQQLLTLKGHNQRGVQP